MNISIARALSARLAHYAAGAVLSLTSTERGRDAANPWAALGYLLDARVAVTHALDELTEVLGEIDPDRVDRVYGAHGESC